MVKHPRSIKCFLACFIEQFRLQKDEQMLDTVLRLLR